MNDPDPGGPRAVLRHSGVPPLVNLADVTELIRASNRLRSRSMAVQRAAIRASLLFHDVVRRSIEVCGK